MRYTVPGIPPGPAAGLSAFMPHMTRRAGSGAQAYKNLVDGQPGTQPIAAPAPEGVAQDRTAQATMGTSRSANSPPVWFPDLYFQVGIQERPGAGMPILLTDPANPNPKTVLPVPATDLRGIYLKQSAALARPNPQRGQRQLSQPARGLRSWKNWGRNA